MPELGDRPANVVNVDEVEGDPYGGRWRRLAQAAGSELTGLNWGRLDAGEEGAPPHSHSADEEIFVMLEGEGDVRALAEPAARQGRSASTRRSRFAPATSSRDPPSTGISHGFRAGEPGLTYLAYGTRNPGDVCYYPRSNKIYFRGLGLIARLEDLDYDDGEPAR